MPDSERIEVGKSITVEPLYLEAKTEEGKTVQVDIMHMLATCPEIRKTWEAACRKLFEREEFPADYVVQVGFILKGGPDGLEQTYVFMLPEVDNATDIGQSSPEVWTTILADVA